MQTKLLDKQDVTAKLEITIPVKEVDKTYEVILRSLSRQVKVPGFRPGKVPKGVLLKRIGGQEVLSQEVRDALLESNYPKAVKELELTPISASLPSQMPTQGSDYTFEIEVDLYPEFSLPDLNEIVIDTEAPALTEEMLEQSVLNLRSEHATMIPVERPIEQGDYVLVETQKDGEPGGVFPVDLERSEDHLVEQLLGKSMSDELELELAQPSGVEEDMEPLKIHVVIKDVKEREKPEADDEFAKTLGLESWQEVEEKLRESIQAQIDSETFEKQREEFVDKLVTETTLSLPTSLLNRRKQSLLEGLVKELKEKGMTFDAYLQSLDENKGREKFEAELQESAENAVKRDLVLERLLEERGTKVSNTEFDDALRYIAARQNQTLVKFKKEADKSWLDNYRFLLSRDKALRETLREHLGLDEKEEEATQEAEAAE